jgi:short-subunit dehydrogenase
LEVHLQKYQPVILVTGCSSGIGLALAKLLWQQERYRVVVTARASSLSQLNKEPLRNTDRFFIRPLDVNNGEERKALIAEIRRAWGTIDILINNAGISYRAVVEHMNETEELNQLRTNYLAPMAMTRLVLPSMRERGRGKIINVSSVSGMLAMPTMASYSASKHALEGASESLWYEMKPLGINVTLIQPGFVNSNSFNNVYYSGKFTEITDTMGPYLDYYQYMTPFISKMMSRSKTTPERVAKTIFRVIKTNNPPLRVPASMDAIVFYYLRRWIPSRLFHRLLFWLLPRSSHWGETYTKSRARGE